MIGRRLLCVCSSSKSLVRLNRIFSGDGPDNKALAACRLFSAASRDIASGSPRSLYHAQEIYQVSVILSGQCHRSFSTTPISPQEIKSVKTPPFAESITEGDIRWQKKVGDTVKEDEVIAEVETDKTSIPVPSPVSGIIKELLFADGAKVTAGAEVCKIQVGAGGGGGADKKADKPQPKAEQQQQPKKESQPREQAQSAPKQEQSQPQPSRATERQPDLQSRSTRSSEGPIPTSSPKVSPAPREPLSRVTPQKPPPARSASADSSASSSGGGGGGGSRSEHRVKMTRMRLRIAERLKGAQNTAAMLTTFNEIDMSNITELRQKYKDEFTKRHNIKLGFMSAFIRASSYALMDMPVVNAVIDDQTNEIVYRDYVDLSVAVATPKGLVVPVLRNIEHMNYAEIEQALNAMGEKAKANQLAIEDMDGGTFTISNGGVFGSLMGTPIINPPQSAILGMHGIFDRPVAIRGEVKIRPMMYVALTYDHRLVDGREAVTFLRKIKAAVEDPRIILLGL